jgi:hypothetical protein
MRSLSVFMRGTKVFCAIPFREPGCHLELLTQSRHLTP